MVVELHRPPWDTPSGMRTGHHGTLCRVWEKITMGMSGAGVYRGPGVYRKVTPQAKVEAAKLTWLRCQGLPAPEVLDVCEDWLLMAEVPGRSAAEPWPLELRPKVIDAMADVARALHALPVDECPYDRTLQVTVPEHVSACVASGGRVELGELARAQPDHEDLVVTHGDLCVPNVLFDPETVAVTGIIDVARLGRSDRYVDLAIATRSIGDERLNPQYSGEFAGRFLLRYGIEPDPGKIAFYRGLDEFT